MTQVNNMPRVRLPAWMQDQYPRYRYSEHLPVWELHLRVNTRALVRPICWLKGHDQRTGVGLSAMAPNYCQRCWKNL